MFSSFSIYNPFLKLREALHGWNVHKQIFSSIPRPVKERPAEPLIRTMSAAEGFLQSLADKPEVLADMVGLKKHKKNKHSQCICESVQWYAILLPLFAYHKTPFGTSQNRTGSSNGFLIGFSACYPLQGTFLSRFLPLQVTTVHGSWPSQYLKTIFCWFVLMPVSRLRNW